MDITTVWQLDTMAVRQMIAEVLSLPESIFFDANDEQDVSKLKSFVTVQISYSDELGHEVKFDGITETEFITVVKNSTISVNAYGENANKLIEKLVTSLKFSSVIQKINQLGFSVLNTSQIRNLTAIVSHAKEERAQVDLTINHIHSASMSLNRGERVDIVAKRS